MEVIFTIAFALFGTAIGSFLNVCVDRLPLGKSILHPPSHCDSCQHRLAPQDLVPVFSYLWLRRRCRYCGAIIPQRPFWVELGTGLLFALSYWHFGLTVQFVLIAFYGSLFIVIGIIDLEHQLILDKITYPAMAAVLIIDIFQSPAGIMDLALNWPWQGVANGAMGGAIGFFFLFIPYLVTFAIYRKEAIGFGDVKLAGLIGLITGPRLVLVSLTLGAILGGVTGIILLLLKLKGRRDALPFGSFLAIAAMIALIWGSDILNWYLGLFRF